MPFVAVTSVKLGVTVSPPDTALSSVTVKVIESPSAALASAMVTAGSSSLVIVPVAVSVASTVAEVSDTARLTVKVSSGSSAVSSVVETVNVCVSPALPAKVSAEVFSV